MRQRQEQGNDQIWYEDDKFPCDMTSIYRVWNEPYEGGPTAEDTVWLRPHEFCPGGTFSQAPRGRAFGCRASPFNGQACRSRS